MEAINNACWVQGETDPDSAFFFLPARLESKKQVWETALAYGIRNAGIELNSTRFARIFPTERLNGRDIGG